MSIIKSFEKASALKKERKWEYLYILIDLHDTVFKACYYDQETFEWFPYAKEALQLMSKRPDFKLILWSSTYFEKLTMYDRILAENDIHIDYFNINPECHNTFLSDFSQKLYFNVGIDDKFGFDPEKDWYKIYDYLSHLT